MIKVLIADDDFWTREGLKSTIDWKTLGFTIVAEAEDATSAYKLYKQTNPDVIITDIRMKQTNGLDLVSKIHYENKNTEFIVLSGYSQFDYAKRAFENGSSAYLLKPINNDEFVKALLEVKEKINKKCELKSQLNLISDELLQLKIVFYNDIINKGFKDSEMTAKASKFGIDMFAPYVLINTEISRMAVSDFETANKLHEHIIESFRHFSSKTQLIDYWTYSQTNVLAMMKCADNMAPAEEIFIPLQEYFYTRTGKYLTIGISSVYDNIANLKDAYLESVEALSFKSLYGNNAIIFYENTISKKTQPVDITSSVTENIITAIFAVDYNKAIELSQEIFERIRNYEHVDINDLRNAIAETISIIVRSIYKDKQGMMEVFSDSFRPFAEIQNCGTINEIQDYFNSFLNRIFENPNVYLECSYDSQVQQIIAYIVQNYSQPLSVESVASVYHLSNSYFMYIFKKETGKTFHAYLTDYRIKMACQFLKKRNYKIYEIAAMVGYNNPERFAKVFKTVTGYTPSQYRTM